ncbi:MAG: phosphatidylcholine/phosphatidylserine synthase [Gordonia sp. (in: high G+C Gram-positive bacteria)]
MTPYRAQRPSSAHRTPAGRGGRRRPHPRPDDDVGPLRRQAAAGRMFVPSALTILAICAGLTAVRSAANGHIDFAMALVVAAALLDGVDGRVARMMGATTRIGAEIDSLADAINFGVVPALIVYLHLLKGSDIGWGLALVYCCAIVLRLARFNTLLDDADAPRYTHDFFVGVPAPAAGLGVLLPVGLSQQFGPGWWTSAPVVGAWLVLVAVLAASRIPTASLKATSVPPHALAGLLIGVAIGAALLLTYPYVLMIVAVAAYTAHIPFAWRSRRWVQARPEHWEDPPAQRRAERRAISRSQPRRRHLPRTSQARLGLHKPVPRPATPEAAAPAQSHTAAQQPHTATHPENDAR